MNSRHSFGLLLVGSGRHGAWAVRARAGVVRALPALAVVIAFSACSGRSHPLQEVVISGASQVDPGFGGVWYDSEGTVFLEVVARQGGPVLRLRLPPGRKLLRAEYGAVGLLFDFEGQEGVFTAALRADEGDQDVAWIGSPDPSVRRTGCGWEYVTRRFSMEERASAWVSKAGGAYGDACENVLNWLSERL